jgi:hypothetical protein
MTGECIRRAERGESGISWPLFAALMPWCGLSMSLAPRYRSGLGGIGEGGGD